MGVVVELKERVADRSRCGSPRPQDRVADPSSRGLARRASRTHGPPAFFFDLACPFSYLAAEQVQRALGQVDWIPVRGEQTSDEPWGRLEAACGHTQRRAVALRLPLVWPERFPAPVPRALRVAAYAAELGAGDRFTLAASRLAFCGGFDLEEPDVLAEAAAASGLASDACLAAARDIARDTTLQATTWALLARGVTRLPAFRVGRHFLQGERAIDAAALMRAPAPGLRPLAPVC
jgi:2-hydroxychromene-2-carboxylate isomerase